MYWAFKKITAFLIYWCSTTWKIYFRLRQESHGDATTQVVVKRKHNASRDLRSDHVAFRMAFECGWIKGLRRLFLQLLPFVLPINT